MGVFFALGGVQDRGSTPGHSAVNIRLYRLFCAFYKKYLFHPLKMSVCGNKFGKIKALFNGFWAHEYQEKMEKLYGK
jgi:hypothetical protein